MRKNMRMDSGYGIELIDTLWNVNKQKKYNKRKWKGN